MASGDSAGKCRRRFWGWGPTFRLILDTAFLVNGPSLRGSMSYHAVPACRKLQVPFAR
jgi:hypothetical protein